MYSFLYFLFPVIVVLGSVQNPSGTTAFEAKISSQLQRNMLSITNTFKNNSAGNVNFTYRFKSERIGKAGTSISNQSGTIKAAPGQEVKLSQTSFSVTPQDTYKLSLEVLDGDKLVAKDSLEYNGK